MGCGGMEESSKKHVLVVDDDITNRRILEDYLEEEGMRYTSLEDGVKALSYLESGDSKVDLVLLDIMMPHMDGLDVLRAIRSNEALAHLPVIMQTAVMDRIQEGINAGAFHYLIKPFSQDVIIPVTRAAIEDSERHTTMAKEVSKGIVPVRLEKNTAFCFRTLEEAHNISYMLASQFPEPEKAVIGLFELIVNAIEHGNLGIAYKQKKDLLSSGKWKSEIERRLELNEYKSKKVCIDFEANKECVKVKISDEGKGFNWDQYLNISIERVTDPNGRGIAVAKNMCFDKVEYQGSGNEVICMSFLPAKEE